MPRFGSTDLNQRDLVRELRKVPGLAVVVVREPVDLLVGFRGVNTLLEVKHPDRPSKPTPKQARFLAEWPGQVQVVSTLDEALAAIGVTR